MVEVLVYLVTQIQGAKSQFCMYINHKKYQICRSSTYRYIYLEMVNINFFRQSVTNLIFTDFHIYLNLSRKLKVFLRPMLT